MMTAVEAPILAEQLTIVPANEASWEDVQVIFGTTDYAGRCGGSSCGSTSNNGAPYVDGQLPRTSAVR